MGSQRFKAPLGEQPDRNCSDCGGAKEADLKQVLGTFNGEGFPVSSSFTFVNR